MHPLSILLSLALGGLFHDLGSLSLCLWDGDLGDRFAGLKQGGRMHPFSILHSLALGGLFHDLGSLSLCLWNT